MSASSTLDYIYGPISQKYCLYFYILSVLNFIVLIVVLIFTVYQGLVKKNPFTFYLNMIALAILYAMFYLQNRLLYNMCTGTMRKEGMGSMLPWVGAGAPPKEGDVDKKAKPVTSGY